MRIFIIYSPSNITITLILLRKKLSEKEESWTSGFCSRIKEWEGKFLDYHIQSSNWLDSPSEEAIAIY